MGLGPDTGEFERAVCDVVGGYHGALAVMSFNSFSVGYCAEFLPDVPRGLVTDPFTVEDWPDVPDPRRKSLAQITDYERVGASFVPHNVADLESDALRWVKDVGAVAFCWTVRSAAVEATARKVVQNVTFEGYLP